PASPPADTPPADPGWRWEVDTADAVKFELPNKWEREAEGKILVTRAPDKSVAMKFDAVASGAKDAKHDEKILPGYIGKHLRHAQLDGGVRDVSHHGFNGVEFEGHGFQKGAKVHWMSEVLNDGKRHR